MIRHLSRLLWNRRKQNGLVVVEILVAFAVLVAVTTLATQAIVSARIPLGFEWADRWDVDVQRPRGEGWTEARAETMRQVVLGLRQFPEVRGIAAVEPAPYTDSNRTSFFEPAGRAAVRYRMADATDEYADVAGLKIVRGRWFNADDAAAAYVPAVVSESFAAVAFPGQDVLGRNIANEHTRSGEPMRERRVVGVVEDYRQDGELMWPVPYVFVRGTLDSATEPPPDHLVLRMAPGVAAEAEERIARYLDRSLGDWSVRLRPQADMRAQKNRDATAPLFALGIVAVFLMLMVFLGLSGVLWQAVTQRTREIGLRRAKGATAGDVHRQVLLEIGLLTTLAVGVGLLLALQLPLLDLIGGIPTHVYALSLALTVAAIYVLTLACGLYPGRLATRMTPAEALHYE